MKKTVTLIGGSFHRQKVEIDERENIVRMRKEMPPVSHSSPLFMEQPIWTDEDFEEYLYFPLDFTLDAPIRNIFFLKGIDPMLFVRNLILDYLK